MTSSTHANFGKRPLWADYGIALAAVSLAVLLRWALDPVLGNTRPYLTLFGGVAFAVWLTRWKPATVAALAGFVMAHLTLVPDAISASIWRTIVDFAGYAFSMSFIIGFGEAMHRAKEREQRQKDSLAVTLASIGDGVIAADAEGRCTLLNAEAVRLTGWSQAEAKGRPVLEIFHIVNERTRQPADNPVERVLQSGKVVGLANHTVLIAKDGTERLIDDSAAPILNADGSIFGVVMVFRDATDERRAFAASSRLSSIVEHSGDAIFTKNLNGEIQTWNASAERLFGYTAEEIVGKHITTLFPPDRLSEEDHILGLLKQGQPCEHFETVRVAKDGRPLHVSISVSPLKDEDGNVTGASKIVRDISEIVAAREALAKERERLATTLASIGDGVILTDEQGHVTYLNAEAERLTGWQTADAAGRLLPEVFHILNEDTREPVENPVSEVLQSGGIVGLANRSILLTKDGREIPIDDSAAPIRQRDGELFGVVLVFRDFTEHQQTEKRLHELSLFAEQNPAPVLRIMRDGKLAYANPAAFRELKEWQLATGQKAPEQVESLAAEALGSGEPKQRELSVGERCYLVSVVPIVELHYANLYCMDVTEQKLAEKALREAHERAERASRAKDDFLAALSHELRTPLTPVLMTAAALEQDPALPADVRSQFALIRRNIDLEARLIDDLLDLTRVSHGKLSMHPVVLDLHEVAGHAMDTVRDEARVKGIELQVVLEAAEHHVFADPARLQQVFWNLVKNAVKFTSTGGRVIVRSFNPQPARVVLVVEDNGIGIPAEVIDRIFAAFDQGNLEARHSFGGLGLGLAISKTIVDLHSGELRAESEGPGRGATFTVELACAAAPTGLVPGTEPRSIQPAPLRLLVVEDHEPTLGAITRLLERDGHRVFTASSVREALSLAAAEPCELVISDLSLSDGTGYELMSEIRERYGWPGVALSGYGMEADVSRSSKAGFATHLVKPVDISQLRRAISEAAKAK
jgi:PAS domain S-box-containing protein